jgi:hypothetical protein
MVPGAVLRAQAPPSAGGAIDPRIQKLVASVSEERLQQLLQKLSSYKTRNSCSDPSAPDGVGAARQWILDELKRPSPKLQVSFDTHVVQTVRGCAGPIEFRNVMAVLPGKTARRIYVSGHYDTVNLGAGGQQTSNSGAGGAAGAQVPTRPGAAHETMPASPPAAPRSPHSAFMPPDRPKDPA